MKEYDNEYSKNLLKFENHFYNIFGACKNSFQMGCGSYLFDGQNYKYQIETYQNKNLFEKSKNKKYFRNWNLYGSFIVNHVNVKSKSTDHNY